MSLENTAPLAEAQASPAPEAVELTEDNSAYDAVWDNIQNGARDEGGKFTSETQEAEGGDAPAAPEAERQQEPAAPALKLPANMTPDMVDIFEGMAPEKSAKLSEWADKLHRQMSDQGRQLGALKPVGEVISSYPEYFNAQGAPAPADAFNRMMAVQKMLDTDPVAGLRQIAEVYGVTDQVLGGGLAGESAQLRSVIADLRQQISSMASPDAIRSQVENSFRERAAVDEVSRFAQSKPLFSEVEAVLPTFVEIARAKLGDATPGALLEAAYDMAVNAMPETRAKQTAAAQAAPAANAKVEAAKKAASINITGAPTGARNFATDEEAMGAAFDRVMRA